MLLCIDIGNTNIKLGLFDGDDMCCHWRITTDRARLADEYAMLLLNLFAVQKLGPADITGCALSSVVPGLTPVFSDLIRQYLLQDTLVISPDTRTGMRINTDFPAEVGADLVMNALGACQLFDPPLIVIGFGTATTFVAVSAQGDLEGVAIAPGVTTSGESLFRATATLPQVALARPASAIGKNTVHSLQAGFVFGFAGLVERLVERLQAELGGSARVVATGGLAELIGPETTVINAIEPNLALIGLKRVFEMNR